MQNASYLLRRSQLETYFDRTAVEAWSRLTSDAPVSKIRATVRAGRDEMRSLILSWLPNDLAGARILDAGCGTGALAVEAARRGAEVVAIDLSPKLVALAQERAPALTGRGRITFLSGDMLDPALGRFDHAVAMDSLIHYRPVDMAEAVSRLAQRVACSVIFTHAPATPALTLMHWAGKLFPRGDRSPAIVPVSPRTIRDLVTAEVRPAGALRENTRASDLGRLPGLGRSGRVASGFYISQAQEVVVA